VEVIQKYFSSLTASQLVKFAALEQLYLDWNSKINVISRKDIDELYTRHVLHSLAIAKVANFKAGTKILDVGCGGGFPGIPLAILFPEVEFTLVDSIGKKIMVVNEVAAALGLTNVKGIHQRVEKLNHRYDYIVSRAVTAFPKFVALTRKLVSSKQRNALPNGIISAFAKRIKVFDIPDFFEESFFETKKIVYLPIV
jgi:16S rRNA (guanine527-N7)-methyltransferase